MKYTINEAEQAIEDSGLSISERDEITGSILSLIAELAERTVELNNDLAELSIATLKISKILEDK